MKQILEALTIYKTINIPLSTMPELHAYIKTLPDLYSFSYTYPDEESVNITLTDIIPKNNEKAKNLHQW